MREEEEEPMWFARWQEELPKPEELMPLSQTLISSDLALAFDIPTQNPSSVPVLRSTGNQLSPSPLPLQADLESPAGDDSARTLKRPRLVWTPQLHKRFVEAVAHLGIKNAVPKTIMQLMSVDGLTRENVASHLQKYRLYLKRMQGLSSVAGGGTPAETVDAATEQLFAGNPIPYPLLGRGSDRLGQESFMPFMAPPLMQHHHQMTAAAAAAVQQQYYHQRQMGHFGFQTRGALPLQGLQRTGASGLGMMRPSIPAALTCCDNDDDDDDVNSRLGGGRRVLTLFPSCGED